MNRQEQPWLHVRECRSAAASASRLYALLADPVERAALLPPQFRDYRFDPAKNQVSYRLIAAGVDRSVCATWSARPPRRLIEDDPETHWSTTWDITRGSGAACIVCVECRWQAASGLAGFADRLLLPHRLRRIYRQVLYRLALVAADLGS